ncbi:hypothetical protein JB92DRAFT_3113516 [Gautieria morchelliformis]|nr:hypothetical protein JB92DRAFT_3113516 [Gautieria morchelliformis]
MCPHPHGALCPFPARSHQNDQTRRPFSSNHSVHTLCLAKYGHPPSGHPNPAITNPQHPNLDVRIHTPTIQFQLNVLPNTEITNPQHPNPAVNHPQCPNLAMNNPQHPNLDIPIHTPTIQFQLNVLPNPVITNPQHPNLDIPICTPTIRFEPIIFNIQPS